jgi:hypothetical protein
MFARVQDEQGGRKRNQIFYQELNKRGHFFAYGFRVGREYHAGHS